LAGHYLDTDEHEPILNHTRDSLNLNIFFSIEFAKSFFGEEEICEICGDEWDDGCRVGCYYCNEGSILPTLQ